MRGALSFVFKLFAMERLEQEIKRVRLEIEAVKELPDCKTKMRELARELGALTDSYLAQASKPKWHAERRKAPRRTNQSAPNEEKRREERRKAPQFAYV